jgi:hypothetical protein
MLRVPGSFNSKHDLTEVKITSQWNNKRYCIKPLLGDILAYLLDEKDKEEERKPNYNNSYNYKGLLSKP